MTDRDMELARCALLSAVALLISGLVAGSAASIGLQGVADFLAPATIGAVIFYMTDRAVYGVPRGGEAA